MVNVTQMTACMHPNGNRFLAGRFNGGRLSDQQSRAQ